MRFLIILPVRKKDVLHGWKNVESNGFFDCPQSHENIGSDILSEILSSCIGFSQESYQPINNKFVEMLLDMTNGNAVQNTYSAQYLLASCQVILRRATEDHFRTRKDEAKGRITFSRSIKKYSRTSAI